MTATLEQIREQMAAQLADGLAGTFTSPYFQSDFATPCAQVLRGLVDYDQAFGDGLHLFDLNVRVYVGEEGRKSSMLLDRYLDPDGDLSVKAALEADTSLGGLVQDLNVIGAAGEQVYVRDSGGPLLGSEFHVTVYL